MLRAGYDGTVFRADLLAGIVLGIVTLPMSMALAIAVGVPPQHGLYTAIVAGMLVPLLGGSRFQITGPTAAYVVVLAPLASRYGLQGILTVGFISGLLLLVMGLTRMGRLIQFIPYPVTRGFSAGIATILAALQIKDALGLRVERVPEAFVAQLATFWQARGSASWRELAVFAVTLALIVRLPRHTRQVPGQLSAIVFVTLLVFASSPLVHGGSFASTLGERFQAIQNGRMVAGIPAGPPLPMWPWSGLTLVTLSELFTPAFAIAVLGAIEALLSAVIADGMTSTRHDPDGELIGLGIGNLVAPFFGGIPGSGALAPTVINIRAGARTPVAAVVHALVVLLAMLLFAPLVAHVPMAALAALLVTVAWNMLDIQHVRYVVRVSPKSDVAVLLTCWLLTVFFNMIVAVSTGVMLASLLFMRRMAELAALQSQEPTRPETGLSPPELPEGVSLYELAGPLFFGAAQQAMSAIELAAKNKVVILALGRVPAIDATGLVALESALSRLRERNKIVIIAGPLPQPRSIFERAEFGTRHVNVYFSDTLDEAIPMGRGFAEATG